MQGAARKDQADLGMTAGRPVQFVVLAKLFARGLNGGVDVAGRSRDLRLRYRMDESICASTYTLELRLACTSRTYQAPNTPAATSATTERHRTIWSTTIAFNARFLADVLTNVDAEQFALELNGPLSPGVFRPIGDDRYVHVVMPLRTTS